MTPSPDPLAHVVVVLDEPQNLVNIAGVVRAMKNTGLSRLRLVRPAEFDPWRITGIAHRADDVVDSTEILETLDEAVSDAVFVLGTTARARTAHRSWDYPRNWAPHLLTHAHQGGTVALLFGREDRGLSNHGLDLCNGLCTIPTHPDYSSLNLAQAMLLVAYELFVEAAKPTEEALPLGKRYQRPATRDELEQTFKALEEGLERLDFFRARKAESVMRTLRTMVSRAEPDEQEARLLRAVGFEIRNVVRRQESR